MVLSSSDYSPWSHPFQVQSHFIPLICFVPWSSHHSTPLQAPAQEHFCKQRPCGRVGGSAFLLARCHHSCRNLSWAGLRGRNFLSVQRNSLTDCTGAHTVSLRRPVFFFFNKQLQCKCTFLRRCIYSKWLPLVYSHPVLSLALGSCSTWSFGLPLWVSGGRGIIKATKAQPSPR